MRKVVTVLILVIFSFALTQSENPDGSFLTALANDADFSTLVSLLDQADLIGTLGSGIYTVFAPDNRVFEDINDEAMAALQADPNLMKSILMSHVIEGAYNLNDLQDAEEGSIRSLQGEVLDFDTTLVGFRVNGADLTSGNVENTYANGLIHGVYDLVIPSSMKDLFDWD